MKSIEDLAREAKMPYYYRTGEISNVENLQRFHDLAIAQYRESLLAGVGEPADYQYVFEYMQKEPFYTADQLAAAVASERERCAKVCDAEAIEWGTENENETDGWLSAHCCAAAIRGRNETH